MAYEEFSTAVGPDVIETAINFDHVELSEKLAEVLGAMALKYNVYPSTIAKVAVRSTIKTDRYWPVEAVDDRINARALKTL